MTSFKKSGNAWTQERMPRVHRSHRRSIALLASAILLLCGCGEDAVEDRQLELAWQDEFEGPAGQLPDSSRWRFDVGGTGWGNAQLEYDTDRAENVSLDGSGHLAITARKENYLGRDYTSGRINTLGFFAQAYGRFEARIRLPVGRGIWPAFWLLGDNFEAIGWPDCGEIDIMEYRGQEPNIVHGSVHGPGYSAGNAVTDRFVLSGGAGLNDDFHLYAIEWNQDQITWLIDETPYHTVTRASLPRGAPWVFDHGFFVILNVAVGGNFVGSPDATTVFPQTMLIDWVRVYRFVP